MPQATTTSHFNGNISISCPINLLQGWVGCATVGVVLALRSVFWLH